MLWDPLYRDRFDNDDDGAFTVIYICRLVSLFCVRFTPKQEEKFLSTPLMMH